MSKFNVRNNFLWVSVLTVYLQPCPALKDISGLLDEAKELTNPEITALRPLFNELQLQYDFLNSQKPQHSPLTEEEFEQQYEATLQEFENQLNKMFSEKATTTYNASLPTLEEIIGKPNLNLMTQEQRLEILDLQGILQDTLDETQIKLNDLVKQALKLETNLLKLEKSKIVTLIFKALQKCYRVASRIGRAAYCTYSHLPQLNTSLHSLYEGADCYLYTTSLVVKIQNEIYQTVKTVRKNTFELAAVYKKVVKQNSLMGKVVTVIMNMNKIARDIFETLKTARHVLDGVENELPVAAKEVENCISNVSPQIPFVLETVSNVTECILFRDETTISYDFLKSEEEYNKEANTILPDLTMYEEDDED